ncbi:MAG: DUF2059 domain-containing protein [Epsilonproteobacteria bacterium]|nr:DUF2059 domain-containing protein [Campylobacterota bacterium]
MRWIKILTLLIFLSSSLVASNAYNAKKIAALQMLDTMNKNRLLERHIHNMVKMEVSQNPILAMKQKEVTQFFMKHLSYQKLKSQLAGIYIKELTLKEMQQFSAFFDTSVGQKMILKMPRLIGLSSNLAQKRIEERYPELINTFLKR